MMQENSDDLHNSKPFSLCIKRVTSHYKNLTANTRRPGNRVAEHYRRDNPIDIEPNVFSTTIVLPRKVQIV